MSTAAAYVPVMRNLRGFGGAVCLLCVGLLVAALTGSQTGAPPRDEAPVVEAALLGTTVSVVHLCPPHARLDRPLTQALLSPDPPHFQLLTRTVWSGGMLTRWRVTVPPGRRAGLTAPTQTIACEADLVSGSNPLPAQPGAA